MEVSKSTVSAQVAIKLFLHHCPALHRQPPAAVEVILLLSRLSFDYRVRVAHLVAAARSGGAGDGAQNDILIDATTCDWRQNNVIVAFKRILMKSLHVATINYT